jgi:PAS domain S-box-containing protein
VEALLGYRAEEVISKTPFYFMPPDEAKRIRGLFREIADSGIPFYGLENKNLHKDGYLIILESSGEPIKDHTGNILGYRGIDRDITQRKKIEEEIQKIRNLESLGLLAGGIAHDFNNVLLAIFANIDLAKLSIETNSEPYLLLSEAGKAIKQAKKLTGQLLTFSRGGDPIKKTIAMPELIVDTCRFVLSGSPIKCEYVIPDDLWVVDVDKGQIWQVLQNLLINASEAMPEGGTIRILVENILFDAQSSLPLKKGKYIKITVADEGKGIENELLAKVFDPYFSSKSKNGEKGTGLGLTICHSIIKKHNGHILLNSEPGQGTKVSFYLPVSAREAVLKTPGDEGAIISASDNKRVLLLDDEDIVLKVSIKMLEQLKYDCETAKDGRTAIELYIRARSTGHPFDLVILDLTIRGGMGGEETIKKLLEIDPDVKAIVVSGYTDNEVIACYKNFGFKAAITKPYNLSTLREVIRKVI